MSAVSTGQIVAARAEDAPRARRIRRYRLSPYLYIAPMIVLIGLFVYWPLLSTFGLSLERWNLNPDEAMSFVGTANFERLLGSELFRAAAANTALYLLASVPLQVLLPIPIAIAIWGLGRAGAIYRTLLFLPTLLSFVAVSIAFVFLLNPIGGALPTALAALGFGPANPLAEPSSDELPCVAVLQCSHCLLKNQQLTRMTVFPCSHLFATMWLQK
jgi:ABC-type sugar transport system permease subunit